MRPIEVLLGTRCGRAAMLPDYPYKPTMKRFPVGSRPLATVWLLLSFCSTNFAARLIDVYPAGPNAIILYFDEGDKRTGDFTEFWIYDAPDEAYYGQLDTVAAQSTANYRLSAAADPNFATAVAPLRVGLKAKEQVALYNYWIYLEWASDLQIGTAYTVGLTDLGSQAGSYTFTYDPARQRSPAIHVNQVGMLAQAAQKYAYLSYWTGYASSGPSYADFTDLEGATGEVRRASDDAVVYAGTGGQGIRFRLTDQVPTFAGFLAYERWYGTPVWEFEFSELGRSIATDPDEEYYVYLEGVGRSHPFRIADDAYDAVFRFIARGVYHQRSGTARTTAHSDWTKPVDHVPGLEGFSLTFSNYSRLTHEATGAEDGDAFAALPAQATGFNFPNNKAPWMLDQPDWGRGGHFDAADYDVYPQHLNLPIQWSLAYLLAPDGFTDGQLNIPESGNGLPDLLDEAKWTLDFYKNTKGPTGGVCGGKETTGYDAPSWPDGSGQSSTDAAWYVYDEDVATSFIYAAAAAQMAAALRRAGDPLNEADGYLQDAITVYEWAENNTSDAQEALEYSGLPVQGYVRDLRLYAAVALYAETGEQPYLDHYLTHTRVGTADDDLYVFEEYDESYAVWLFSLIPPDSYPNFGADALALQFAQRQALVNWSRTWGTEMLAEERPMRHIAARFAPPLGGTSSSTPRLWPQIMAYHHTGDEDLLAQMLASNDFYLGGQPDNKVYISSAHLIGAESYPLDPLHQDSNHDGVDDYIPGLVLYAICQPYLYDHRMFPAQLGWPQLETNSDGRIYILQAEFTFHQNNVPAAAAFGYLNSVLNPDAAVSTRPSPPSAVPSSALDVRPNPTPGAGSIRLPAPLLETVAPLRDVTGRSWGTVVLRAAGGEARFELPVLPAGNYFLTLKTKAGIRTAKVAHQ